MATNSVAGLLAVILAGGAGKRMGGADKGLQLLHGMPLVAHVRSALSSQVDDVLIVANRNIQAYKLYARVASDAGRGFAGPLAGLQPALTSAGARQLLSVPVDCPCPPADLAMRLHAELESTPAAQCAVAWDGQRAQPLFALYRPGLANAAEQALRDNVAVCRWQQDIGATQADFSHCPGAFANLNTQADLDAFEQNHCHH